MALEVPPPEALPVAVEAPRAIGLISIGLLIVSVMFALAGQLTLKAAMDRIGPIRKAQVQAAGDTISRAAREPRLWIGLFLFGVSAVFWLVVLSNVPLSVAYPFVGITYVLLVAFSRFVHHEHVPFLRWVGAATIAFGIILIGLSYRRVSGV